MITNFAIKLSCPDDLRFIVKALECDSGFAGWKINITSSIHGFKWYIPRSFIFDFKNKVFSENLSVGWFSLPVNGKEEVIKALEKVEEMIDSATIQLVSEKNFEYPKILDMPELMGKVHYATIGDFSKIKHPAIHKVADA